MVVLCHSSVFLSPLTNGHHIGVAMRYFLAALAPLGTLGVELFFVLSGYLIGGILIRDYLSADSFSFSTVRNFWLRRWFRTIPVNWLILSVNIVLYTAMHILTRYNNVLFYFFLQNLWYPHPVYFFGEAWSLAVEEWFYLTLPVVLLISTLMAKPKNKKYFLLRVFIGYLLVFVTVRTVNAINPLYPDQDSGIRKIVLFRLDAVMYGVLFAWLAYYYDQLIIHLKKRLLAISLIGALLMYYILYKGGFPGYIAIHRKARFLSDAFLYLFIPFFFSFCLPYAAQVRHIACHKCTAFITFISKISYSMYLVHYSLIFIPFFSKLQLSSRSAIIGLYILYWLLVIGLSALLYKFYEHPIMRLRDKISRQ